MAPRAARSKAFVAPCSARSSKTGKIAHSVRCLAGAPVLTGKSILALLRSRRSAHMRLACTSLKAASRCAIVLEYRGKSQCSAFVSLKVLGFGSQIVNLIGRYIFREAFGSWLVVMLVLFTIFMTNQLAEIFGDAASDRLPRDAVLAIFGLTALRYLDAADADHVVPRCDARARAAESRWRDGGVVRLRHRLDAAAGADRRLHVAARARPDVARLRIDAGRESTHRRDSLHRGAERGAVGHRGRQVHVAGLRRHRDLCARSRRRRAARRVRADAGGRSGQP